MKLAHILVCHTTDPRKAIESIPHCADTFWYVFLHSADPAIEESVEALISARDGNVFPYKANRGLATSWNDGLHLAFEAGCEAALLLNDDLFFYDGGYNAFRQTIEVVRSISTNVSHVTVVGLETGSSAHSGQIIPQNFACCAIMREAVERVGYFDENFTPAYYEDVDFARRVALAGMTLHLDERVLVEHERSSTFRQMSDQDRMSAIEMQERNRLYFVEKWGSHDDPWYIRPFDDTARDLIIPFAIRKNPYSRPTTP